MRRLSSVREILRQLSEAFNAVDTYCTDEKYAEVDTKKLKTEDVNEIVDLCFQCKLCWIKCPYTPGNHEWAIDFPRLMARAKAKQVKDKGVPLVDKVLGHPDAVGKLGTAMSPLANWAGESGLHRQFMQSLLGIHKDKKLPPFASKTFASQFSARRKTLGENPLRKSLSSPPAMLTTTSRKSVSIRWK